MSHEPATCPAFGGCADCRISKFEATSPDVVIDKAGWTGLDPFVDPRDLYDFERGGYVAAAAYNTGVDDGRPGVYPHADPVETGAPAFTAAADPTLARARAIYNQRGNEYGDTWALENIVTTHLDHVLHMLGIFGLSLAERRLLEMGSLVDVKEARIKHGPYKLDNSDDSINYRAAFSGWREEYKEANGI